ncbi:hypothetical protein EVAR_50218_1 [Eumeta japonica]|uniref:Uncharacterized protein n=1 Tax=Eumeta variegata TaxID=151549 RepID=A0A4C1WWS5_EUMVA|nr:hypothetical protein EVAR_50218_1 [Eumeta japonica]
MDCFEPQIQELLTQADSDGPAFDGNGECSDIDQDIKPKFMSHTTWNQKKLPDLMMKINQPLSIFQSSRKRLRKASENISDNEEIRLRDKKYFGKNKFRWSSIPPAPRPGICPILRNTLTAESSAEDVWNYFFHEGTLKKL